jgi:hypothetical protein
MKEYKFIFPDTSDIEVGDVVEIYEVRHVLTEDVKCRDCSLRQKCDDLPIPFPCGYSKTAAFKIEKP